MMKRPEWEIDRVLAALVGEEVRVGASGFAPPKSNGEWQRCIPVDKLILPDNTSASGLPVHFEGRLSRFVREIGVVSVVLDAPANPEKSVEGLICFRGATAVILRGPAVVELSFPFRVEKLPRDVANYWNDLKFPRVQFTLPI